jgi:hypothetical protein
MCLCTFGTVGIWFAAELEHIQQRYWLPYPLGAEPRDHRQVDGKRALFGSMNLDPLSADTEMAVLNDSPLLAADVVALIWRDMQPETGWRVSLDALGRLQWAKASRP